MEKSNLVYDLVQDHLIGLVPQRPTLLLEMEEIALKTKFPIIGPAAGHACYTLARMIGARRIFEMGSGFGYSTAWFSRAVVENGGGEVHHVVWDSAVSAKAQTYLAQLGYAQIVRYHDAEAIETLKNSDGQFDLIFNDIDKEAYPASLPVIKQKLRKGGILIVDNVLWDGAIFDEQNQLPSTVAIRQFNDMVKADPDFISMVLPIRDGLLVAIKV